MKHKVVICVCICMFMPLLANAQRIYETSKATYNGSASFTQSHSYGPSSVGGFAAPSGTFYSGSLSFYNGSLAPRAEIYQPFTQAVPSPTKRRKALNDSDDDDSFDGRDNGAGRTPGDVGNQEQKSPIGSALIMLALIALYAGYKFLMIRRKEEMPLVDTISKKKH